MTETAHPSTNRSVLFGVLAVLIASAAASGAWWVVNGYQQALDVAKRPADTREVLVASHDLEPGDTIADSDLVTTRVSLAGAAPESFYANPDELLGGLVTERILAGEPIRRERLEDGQVLDDTTLEPGTRAVTLRVDRAAGVGGLVLPGAYVDVIVTIRPDANALDAKWVTETIIQAVRVLAVGDNSSGSVRPQATGTNAKRTEARAPSREVFATLEVEPEEAEKIAMATTRGDVYLALRPRNDFELLENKEPLVTNALVGIDARPTPGRTERVARRRAQAVVPPPPVAPGTEAEVISGSNTSIQRFTPEGQRILDPRKAK